MRAAAALSLLAPAVEVCVYVENKADGGENITESTFKLLFCCHGAL